MGCASSGTKVETPQPGRVSNPGVTMGCDMKVHWHVEDSEGRSSTTTSAPSDTMSDASSLAEAEELGVCRLSVVPRLAHLGSSAVSRPLPGGFTQVRQLANSSHSEVLLFEWRSPETETKEPVVVKKICSPQIHRNREHDPDERSVLFNGSSTIEAEDSLGDIQVLSYLAKQIDRSEYLLRLRGVYADESRYTWLVTDFADGGDLFDLVASGKALLECEFMRFLWQLLQAVAYLHKHSIGHRDISLENILLCNGKIKLMDFGMAVRSQSTSGTPIRYFLAVGKDSYRAPECYVPPCSQVTAMTPREAIHGDVTLVRTGESLCEVKFPVGVRPNELCLADVLGYEVGPADLFACGICLFILSYQCPPWKEATFSDPNFKFAYDQRSGDSIATMLRRWNRELQSATVMQLLSDLLHFNPASRPKAEDCLDSSF